MLVAGAKAATQTPPIRSGRRVIFTTLDDGTGLVDLAFFDDSHDACAHTVFHSWLLLVRGVVQRRGPRSVSVVGAAAWNLAELAEVRREEGLEGVEAARRRARHRSGGRRRGAARDGQGAARGRLRRFGRAAHRRVGRPGPYGGHRSADDPHAHGVRDAPLGRSAPRGQGPSVARKLWHQSPGSAGAILCVRFQLPPVYEAALPGLLGLLEEFTPVVEALPPDGALADLGGAERYFGRDAVELASVIRVRALAHFGVDCVIGAGPGPMLARIALRAARPGLTCAVPEDAVAEFLADRPVAVLPGVGTATARALCEFGLDTLGRVAAAPLSTLQRLVGAEEAGRELHEKANGIDRGRVVPNAVSRSLATDRPFERDELDPERHRRALLSAAEEIGARLRAVDKVCRTLTLTVRYADRSATTRSRTLAEPTAHSAALAKAVYGMYDALGLQRARVRAIALRAEGLTHEQASHQLTFDPADERIRRIEEVADRARAKFGPRAVMPGRLAA
ncbi:DNA polymerase IV [Streptomyces glaucescens]